LDFIGLAFDVLYHYMTAAEQSQVMAELAQLKDEGRIEVLRENRDHYHVFAFIDGERPQEQFIAASLGQVRPGKAAGIEKGTSRNTDTRTAKVAKTQGGQRSREAHHAQKKSIVVKSKAKSAPSTRRKR